GADGVAAALGASFAAAVRVIDGVHGGAANVRANPLPAVAARFADHDVHRVGVADLANRGPAAGGDAAGFTAGERDWRPVRFAGHERGMRAGRAAQAGAATGLHLDAVNRNPQRDPRQWQAIADVRRGIWPVLDCLAGRKPVRSENVSLLAVRKV